jgi:hypothetical protein
VLQLQGLEEAVRGGTALTLGMLLDRQPEAERLRRRSTSPSSDRYGLLTTHGQGSPFMIILGGILLIIGIIAYLPVLQIIGIVLLVVGLALVILGQMGRAVGGRSHYF